MKLLQGRSLRSKHRQRIFLYLALDSDRLRLQYRLLEFRDDGRGCDRWAEAEFGNYADRRQTDHMRAALAQERLTGND